jgi:3-phenylpropionate/cinnamic acid dioxygenase small subunit
MLAGGHLVQNALTPRRLAPQDVQQFIIFEAQLLNEKHFEQWFSLLADEIVYWVPAREGQTSGKTEASIIYDDQELIRSRITRLRHPKMWSQQPPARTLRLVSNIMLDHDFESSGIVHSDFAMFEFRNNEQRIFGGSYEHQLRRVDGAFKIARKTVRLINAEGTLWNLAVPF